MRYRGEIIITVLFLCLTIVSAQDPNVYNNCEIYGNCEPEGLRVFPGQNVSINTNSTDYWNTDIGSLGTVNSTQFENNAGTLSIIQGWLESLTRWNVSGTDLYPENLNYDVGIGTTAPSEKLDIENGAIEVGHTTNTYDELISFRRNNVVLGVIDSPFDGIRLRALDANRVSMTENSGKGVTVISGGNVGIGTTTPNEIVHIKKDSQYLLTLQRDSFVDGDEAFIRFANSGVETVYSAYLGTIREAGGGGQGAIVFGTGGNPVGNDNVERMRIDSSGNVGIGTSSPDQPIHINTTAANGLLIKEGGNFIAQLRDASGAGAQNGVLQLYSGGVENVRMYAHNAFPSWIKYRLGIGTTTPDRKLDILDSSNPQLRLTQTDGSVYADFEVNSSGDLVIGLDGTTNQLVLEDEGNVFMQNNLSVSDINIRNPSSLSFGDPPFVSLTAFTFTVGNQTRSVVSSTGDIGGNCNSPNMCVVASVQRDSGDNSSASVLVDNYLIHDMGMIKTNPTHFRFNESGFLYNEWGRLQIINQNNDGISIGFFDDGISSGDFSFLDWENLTEVIEIENKTFNFSTRFNYDVELSGDLNITGDIIGNGSQLFDVNETDTLQSVTDRNSTTTNNITIGEYITFSNGESFDNAVDGWIRNNGNLSVTGNIFALGNISTVENLIATKSIYALDIGSPGSFISNLFVTNITASLVSATLVSATTIVSDTINSTTAYFTDVFATNIYSDFLQVAGNINQTTGNSTINLVGAEMYSKNNAVITTIPAVDTYVNVTEGMTEEFSNGFTISGGKMIAQISGRYTALLSASANDGNNKVFHFSIGIDGVDQDNCHIPRKVGAGGDIGSWSVSCSLLLEVGDSVTIMVENVDDGSDILVNDANLLLSRMWNS